MYIPKYFEMSSQEDMFQVIEQYPFGTLFSMHRGLPFASHLPLIANKEKNVLFGHFARSNRQWEDICQQNVLVVFQGPHSYISPSWYETKAAVPTWNYVTVHAYGRVELVNDEKEVLNIFNEMVKRYEAPNSGYTLSDANPEWIDQLLNHIVMFQIGIDHIEGKCKLGQNNSKERQVQITQHLKENNKIELVKFMKKYS